MRKKKVDREVEDIEKKLNKNQKDINNTVKSNNKTKSNKKDTNKDFEDFKKQYEKEVSFLRKSLNLSNQLLHKSINISGKIASTTIKYGTKVGTAVGSAVQPLASEIKEDFHVNKANFLATSLSSINPFLGYIAGSAYNAYSDKIKEGLSNVSDKIKDLFSKNKNKDNFDDEFSDISDELEKDVDNQIKEKKKKNERNKKQLKNKITKIKNKVRKNINDENINDEIVEYIQQSDKDKNNKNIKSENITIQKVETGNLNIINNKDTNEKSTIKEIEKVKDIEKNEIKKFKSENIENSKDISNQIIETNNKIIETNNQITDVNKQITETNNQVIKTNENLVQNISKEISENNEKIINNITEKISENNEKVVNNFTDKISENNEKVIENVSNTISENNKNIIDSNIEIADEENKNNLKIESEIQKTNKKIYKEIIGFTDKKYKKLLKLKEKQNQVSSGNTSLPLMMNYSYNNSLNDGYVDNNNVNNNLPLIKNSNYNTIQKNYSGNYQPYNTNQSYSKNNLIREYNIPSYRDSLISYNNQNITKVILNDIEMSAYEKLRLLKENENNFSNKNNLNDKIGTSIYISMHHLTKKMLDHLRMIRFVLTGEKEGGFFSRMTERITDAYENFAEQHKFLHFVISSLKSTTLKSLKLITSPLRWIFFKPKSKYAKELKLSRNPQQSLINIGVSTYSAIRSLLDTTNKMFELEYGAQRKNNVSDNQSLYRRAVNFMDEKFRGAIKNQAIQINEKMLKPAKKMLLDTIIEENNKFKEKIKENFQKITKATDTINEKIRKKFPRFAKVTDIANEKIREKFPKVIKVTDKINEKINKATGGLLKGTGKFLANKMFGWDFEEKGLKEKELKSKMELQSDIYRLGLEKYFGVKLINLKETIEESSKNKNEEKQPILIGIKILNCNGQQQVGIISNCNGISADSLSNINNEMKKSLTGNKIINLKDYLEKNKQIENQQRISDSSIIDLKKVANGEYEFLPPSNKNNSNESLKLLESIKENSEYMKKDYELNEKNITEMKRKDRLSKKFFDKILVMGMFLIKTIKDFFTSKMKSAFDFITDIGSDLLFNKGKSKLLKNTFGKLKDIFFKNKNKLPDNVIDITPKLPKKISPTIKNIGSKALTFGKNALNIGKNVSGGLIKSIGSKALPLGKSALNIGKNVSGGLIRSLGGKLLGGATVGLGIYNGIKQDSDEYLKNEFDSARKNPLTYIDPYSVSKMATHATKLMIEAEKAGREAEKAENRFKESRKKSIEKAKTLLTEEDWKKYKDQIEKEEFPLGLVNKLRKQGLVKFKKDLETKKENTNVSILDKAKDIKDKIVNNENIQSVVEKSKDFIGETKDNIKGFPTMLSNTFVDSFNFVKEKTIEYSTFIKDKFEYITTLIKNNISEFLVYFKDRFEYIITLVEEKISNIKNKSLKLIKNKSYKKIKKENNITLSSQLANFRKNLKQRIDKNKFVKDNINNLDNKINIDDDIKDINNEALNNVIEQPVRQLENQYPSKVFKILSIKLDDLNNTLKSIKEDTKNNIVTSNTVMNNLTNFLSNSMNNNNNQKGIGNNNGNSYIDDLIKGYI